MSDQPKPEPRIDSDDIGRCSVACPLWDHCAPASAVLTRGTGICEPWVLHKLAELSIAAKDHKAMEKVRASDRMWVEAEAIREAAEKGGAKC